MFKLFAHPGGGVGFSGFRGEDLIRGDSGGF